MNDGLQIRKSLVEDGGWGVFTTKPFKMGDKLTTYDGYDHLEYMEIHEGDTISSKYDMDEDVYIILTHQDYILEPKEGGCIFGYKKEYLDRHPECGWGSLINDKFCIKEWKEEAFRQYIEDRGGLKTISTDIYNCSNVGCDVLATRDIEAGEELYSHLGVDFWMKHLNDNRYNEGFQYCKCANGKKFLDYVEMKYNNFDLRSGLNYTPSLLNE